MLIAKLMLGVGFAWGLSERSWVALQSKRLVDALLLAIALEIGGLVLLSWMAF